MITAIRIGNFKAFAEAQRIPFCPLTLIYGQNSSGKSSIIHSLVLIRHALEKGELDVHRTNIGGDSVDLGGFRQFIHQRDTSRRMEWSADLDTASFNGRLSELLAPVKRITVSLSIGITLDDYGRSPSGALPKIHLYEILGDGVSLVRMSLRPNGRLQLDRLNHEHPVLRQVIKAIVEVSTTALTVQLSDFDGLEDAIADIVPDIVASMDKDKFLPDGIVKDEAFNFGVQSMLMPISRGNRKEELARAIRTFIPQKLDELIRGVNQAIAEEIGKLQYLGPLRSYPPRHLAFSQHHDPNWFAGGGYAWDVVRRDSKVRELVNNWLMAPDRLQTRYELVLRDLVGIDQLDSPLIEGLERLSEEGLDIKADIDIDESGDVFPVIKDPEKEAIKIRELIRSSDIEKLNELIMFDRRSDTVVSHRDVGIGVSQVLPVLVGAYASTNQIIAIEQPEIHLHPALQADLGDVFIRSALSDSKNRFLIETHSEHLLLRIMRRMRQTSNGNLPEDIPKITPEDVCILYVQPKGTASVIRNLELDQEGQLLDAWPGGFFEEGYRERFD